MKNFKYRGQTSILFLNRFIKNGKTKDRQEKKIDSRINGLAL